MTAPLGWEPPEDQFPVAENTGWRGELHPAPNEPGWPEPPEDEPGEYGLLKRDAEREDDGA